MRVKNLYLHIGRGKTGTTAIQSFLSSNREILRQHGLHYVLADDAGRGLGHQNFAKSFIDKPPYYMKMPVRPERFQEAVAEELLRATESNVLLSSENLTLANVEKLADFFIAILGSVTIKIIFFARSQDELAESQYNQMIKLAVCKKTFDEYIETELDELDFFALLSPWAQRFGKSNMITRVYDGSRATVIDDFLTCLDLPSQFTSFASAQDSSSNESVGYLALEIFRVLNAFDFPRKGGVYALLNQAIKAVDLPPLFFNAQQARAFRDRFRASNEFFIQEYLGRRGDDLGGRKYSDAERDKIYASIQKVKA